MKTLLTSYSLNTEYESYPRKYGDDFFYMAETHMIQYIGKNPGMTVTDIATEFRKTTSAVSQIIKKLKKRNLIEQVRNTLNNREYNLFLNDNGWEIFNQHEEYDRVEYEKSCLFLEEFSEEELENYIKIQECLNNAIAEAIKRSRN